MTFRFSNRQHSWKLLESHNRNKFHLKLYKAPLYSQKLLVNLKNHFVFAKFTGGLFRTLINIFDGAFLRDLLTTFSR